MVMEEPPSPQCVGREFVRQYYTLLNKAPHHLHRFYNSASSFVHGGLDAPDRETVPVIGQTEIHKRIQQLNFLDCHAKISQVDSQATLGNGVVVQVTGELSNGGQPMRRFTQTFVLAAQSPKNFYVHNDIFRYQDFVFSDEDGEWEYSRSEDTTASQPQPPAPYFPAQTAPTTNANQTPQQVQQPAPVQTVTVQQQQHVHLQQQAPRQEHVTLNGHQEQDIQGNLSLGLNANDSGDNNQDFESDVESSKVNSSPSQAAPPPQPAHEPAPIVSSEPKTYANLVKSGPVGSYAQTAQHHAQQASVNRITNSAARSEALASNTSPSGPNSAPQHQRPRTIRPPRNEPLNDSTRERENAGNNNTTLSVNSGRRYSDSHQLFLGNLPQNATKEELRVIFEKFGAIADLRVFSKPLGPGGQNQTASGRAIPNYAFLTYEDAQSAQNCLNNGPLYYPSEDSPDAQLLNVQEKKSRMAGGGGGGRVGGGGGSGGGNSGGGGNRGGARPPRPAFSRPPYQPQRR